MKPTMQKKHHQRPVRRRRSLFATMTSMLRKRNRSGSTLLVVIALMGMLALLGLMFFTFASQENESAKHYLESAKHINDPELGPDVYFDWALRQIIRGAERGEVQSALGAHLSLLANAYGSDAHPHSGKGIDLINDRMTVHGTQIAGLTAFANVDLDADGTPDMVDADQDGIHDFLELNRSVAANVINPGGGIPVPGIDHQGFEHTPERFPQPDVDYTYPDINNAFLANVSKIWVTENDNGDGLDRHEDFNGDGILNDGIAGPAPYQITVIKPSYWRPELLTRLESAAGALVDEDSNGDGIWDPVLEDANGNGVYDVTDFNGNGDQSQTEDGLARFDPTWYWQPWSRSLVLRPHPLHFYIPPVPRAIPGLPPPPPPLPPSQARFLDDNNPTDAGIIASLPGLSKGFPFAGPRDVNTGDTIALREGVWRGWRQAPDAALNIAQYEFDVDADNDGIREAILMDLGFPVQERPSDGALYVPMFGMTILDADGLINLNTSGNLSGDTSAPGAGGVFGDGLANGVAQVPQLSISKSNSGLTPFEINPAWALDGIPIDAGAPTPDQSVDVTTLTDYFEYFGRSPVGNGDDVNRWELANMEMWWLNKGRIEYGGALPEVHEGRLGDASRVYQVLQESVVAGRPPIGMNDSTLSFPYQNGTISGIGLFPFPGVWDRDDNRNANYGGAGNDASGRTLAFSHPLSVSGQGSFISGVNPKALDMFSPTGTPHSWLQYSNYEVGASTPEWGSSANAGGALMQNTLTGQLFFGPSVVGGTNVLIDDMSEIIVEPRSKRSPADEIFPVSDSALLVLSNSDINTVGVHSRVRDVMPGNINPNDTSVAANDRRGRFTTTSWDRKQFSFPFIARLAAGDAPGENGVDDDRNGIIDDATEIGWPKTDDIRAWEFNLDADGDQQYEFPPQFPGVAAWSGYGQGVLPQIPQDPFRAPLRRILNVERGNRNEAKLQFRLSVNSILDVVRAGENGGHPINSPLEYRPLIPHVTDTTLTAGGIITLTAGEALPVLSTLDSENQEFWARYDRQRLARDIYVMLYTLCGGQDDLDYTTTDGPTLYTGRQRQEMAQFAVNLVDQLDQDHVMTVFEYDNDLSNGWNLDDQAHTDEGGDRGVAIGVEEQELTFSETLWVHQAQLDNDNTQTPFDETNPPAGMSGGVAAFHFAQIELRNASPRGIDLAMSGVSTDAATGVWRVRWVNQTDLANVPRLSTSNNIGAGENGLIFKAYGAMDNSVDSIGAGQLFTIGTTNDTGPTISDLFVNIQSSDTGPSTFERIAPQTGSGSAALPATTPSPNTDLDLTHPADAQRFEIGNGMSGDFISTDYTPTVSNPILVLERRADPNMPQLSAVQNPWVVVDYTQFQRQDFIQPSQATMASPDFTTTQTAFQNLRSIQRREPLQGEVEASYSGGSDPDRQNSINGTNTNSPTNFDLLQPQFDRDFASLTDLFLLRVRGPRQLTRSIVRGDQGPTDQFSSGNLVPYTASSKILVPIHPNGGAQWNNHWHRLLSLVEIPTRMHQQLGGPFGTTRVPGKINLNTMRHAHVFTALLDDPLVHTEVDRTNGQVSSLIDPIPDWWGDFLESRDGEHPDFPGTGFTLPGYFSSSPFRDLGHMDDVGAGDDPVADTVLRDHPTPGATTGGGLFDINTSGNGNNLLRRRLLAKVLNNTTTRSNVFFVFIHVQFHEAYEDPATGAVRVGGRIDLNSDGRRDDGHRGFFIVDRSAAEEAYDPKTGTFDWKQLVKHRITIN